MLKRETEIQSIEHIPWMPIEGYPDGCYARILSQDAHNPGNYTRLLRIEPGVRTTQVMAHDFWEEIYILDGYLIDRDIYQAKGYYGCRPPGMTHGPIRTPVGFFALQFRYYAKDLHKPEMEIQPVDHLPWTPMEGFPQGFYEKILSRDANNPRNYARLARAEPGLQTTRTLQHDFWEEIYVVEGYLVDREFFQKKGDYGCRPPGMLHNPVRTSVGFTTLEFRYDGGDWASLNE